MAFWLDPCILFANSPVLPSSEMSTDEKLNALSRLSLIISLGLYVMFDSKQWLQFLILAFGVIIVLYFISRRQASNREGFSITPTYSSDDFEQTIVAPTYAEEWHNPPPTYEIVTQIPEVEEMQAPLNPQNYPYGQYLTTTNLLPSDEREIRMGNGSLKTAREFVNSMWLRNDVAYKENMMRIHRKRLARRFRQNCQDTFSPYHSY